MAIARGLPTANADGSAVVLPSRAGRYLEAYSLPVGAGKQFAYADEGSYFTTYNVTDGTGIAGHAAPVQADLSTKPLLHLFNGGTKYIYPDFVRIRMTAIGAGATTTDFTVWVDSNGASSRSSAGTAATIVNVNPGSSQTSGASIWFGAVVATAGTGEVRVDHQRVRSVVAVVEDQYIFTFGNPGYGPATGGITMAGTAVIAAQVNLPPVVVPPGGNFKLVQWGASQSGAHSFEFTIGFVAR
jgi:hypothetical protein